MMTKTMTRFALGAVAFGVLAAPAAAQSVAGIQGQVAQEYADARALTGQSLRALEGQFRALGLHSAAMGRAISGQTLARLGYSQQGAQRAGARVARDVARLQYEVSGLRGALRAGQRGLTAINVAPTAASPLPLPPEAADAQDPADSLYRAARRDLNDRRYRDAARKYAQLRADYPSSTYVADSYYWEAQAHYRLGGGESLQRSMELIQVQAERHPSATTRDDARSLMVRIQSQQARRGNAVAAQQLARNAASNCDEEEDQIRATALSALLQMDPDRAAPILREVLEDRDECSAELREQAIFLLAQNPTDETVATFIDLALTNPDPDEDVREAAVFWLSQVRTEEALEALLSILESGDADAEIQEQAIYAVSQHSSERVTEILRDYAENQNAPAELRENAIFWIGQRDGGARYLRGLYDGVGPDLREQILFAVAQERNAESRDWLLARALDESESTEVRKNALFWAGEAGIQMDAVLRVYETADDVELREQAIFVISQDKSTEAVDALMEIAREEENAELKENAIFWLGQSRDPRVAEFLLELIRGGGGV